MTQHDYPAFSELWTVTRAGYGQGQLPEKALQLEFGALADYSLSEVMVAIGCHKRDIDQGRFCPTAAHILSHLKGPAPDAGRVMPNAYLEFEPEDPYALPALPLTPSERERLETERRERLAEEKRRVREMLKGSGIGRAFPAEPKQRERDERMTAPVDDGPMVRTGPDGKMQFRCADGRWC